MKFLKPTLWKIVLFIAFVSIFYFWYSSYVAFSGLSFGCSWVSENGGMSQSNSFTSILQQVPNVITGNYNPCTVSQSFWAARVLVLNSTFIFIVIITYIFSSGIVFYFSKLQKKKKK